MRDAAIFGSIEARHLQQKRAIAKKRATTSEEKNRFCNHRRERKKGCCWCIVRLRIVEGCLLLLCARACWRLGARPLARALDFHLAFSRGSGVAKFSLARSEHDDERNKQRSNAFFLFSPKLKSTNSSKTCCSRDRDERRSKKSQSVEMTWGLFLFAVGALAQALPPNITCTPVLRGERDPEVTRTNCLINGLRGQCETKLYERGFDCLSASPESCVYGEVSETARVRNAPQRIATDSEPRLAKLQVVSAILLVAATNLLRRIQSARHLFL